MDKDNFVQEYSEGKECHFQKEKIELGESNQNIPILDMYGSKYRDMIIHSRNLNKWNHIILSEINDEKKPVAIIF